MTCTLKMNFLAPVIQKLQPKQTASQTDRTEWNYYLYKSTNADGKMVTNCRSGSFQWRLRHWSYTTIRGSTTHSQFSQLSQRTQQFFCVLLSHLGTNIWILSFMLFILTILVKSKFWNWNAIACRKSYPFTWHWQVNKCICDVVSFQVQFQWRDTNFTQSKIFNNSYILQIHCCSISIRTPVRTVYNVPFE